MLICVTNSTLPIEPFEDRFRKLCQCDLQEIILREKQLTETEYFCLAKQCQAISASAKPALVLNHFIDVAVELQLPLQLSIPVLRETPDEKLQQLPWFGVSVHSVAEAVYAESRGASQLIAGHIFATDCKKGVPPRGLEFLHSVVESASIPVYGIGGITTSERYQAVQANGAVGGCIMSGLMICENPQQYLWEFTK